MNKINKKNIYIFFYIAIFLIILILFKMFFTMNIIDKKTSKIMYNKDKYSESETITEDSETKLKMLTIDIDKNLTVLKNNQNALKDKMGFLTNNIDEKITTQKFEFDSFREETNKNLEELEEKMNNYVQVKINELSVKHDTLRKEFDTFKSSTENRLDKLESQVTELTEEMTSLKKSVSDGKNQVASAITAMNPTSGVEGNLIDNDFSTIASEITNLREEEYNAGIEAGKAMSTVGTTTISSNSVVVCIEAGNDYATAHNAAAWADPDLNISYTSYYFLYDKSSNTIVNVGGKTGVNVSISGSNLNISYCHNSATIPIYTTTSSVSINKKYSKCNHYDTGTHWHHEAHACGIRSCQFIALS